MGGMIASPRSTLRGILWRSDGHLAEVFVWMAVALAIVEPVRVGRALLITRVEPLDGVSLVLQLFMDRMSIPLIGAGVGAVVLRLLVRRSEAAGPHLYAALDACMFMLVPYLALAVVGALLRETGSHPATIWFLPHRPLRGRVEVVVVRAAVAFGVSLGLYLWLAVDIRTRGSASEDGRLRKPG